MIERGSAAAGPLSAYPDSLAEPVRAVLTPITARAREVLPEVTQGVSDRILLARGDEIDAAFAR